MYILTSVKVRTIKSNNRQVDIESVCILSHGCSNFLHQPSRERKKKQNKRFLVRKRLVTERFYHEQGKHYRGYYYKTCYFGLSQNKENKNLKNTKISINWMKSWIFVTVFQTCTGKFCRNDFVYQQTIIFTLIWWFFWRKGQVLAEISTNWANAFTFISSNW